MKKACALSQIPAKKVLDMQIIKQSVDARKKDALSYTYTVHLVVDEHQKVKKNPAHVQEVHPVKYQIPAKPENASDIKAAVIGAGPAGLFAAYELAQCGLCPQVYERGKAVEERQQDVETYWSEGSLNPESNVQFGEGGAGTFSDGKLNTLVKDKFGRSPLCAGDLCKIWRTGGYFICGKTTCGNGCASKRSNPDAAGNHPAWWNLSFFFQSNGSSHERRKRVCD